MGISYTGKINKIKGTRNLPPQAIIKEYNSNSDLLWSNVTLRATFNDDMIDIVSGQDGVIRGTEPDVNISSVDKLYGSSSLQLTGTSLLVYNYTDVVNFGANDFCIEFSANINKTADGYIFSVLASDELSTTLGLRLINTGTGFTMFSNFGSGVNETVDLQGIDIDQWHSYAIDKVGSNLNLYIDGNIIHTINVGSSSITTSKHIVFGGASLPDRAIPATTFTTGYIDDVRITTGVNRYNNASYTPQSQEFPIS